MYLVQVNYIESWGEEEFKAQVAFKFNSEPNFARVDRLLQLYFKRQIQNGAIIKLCHFEAKKIKTISRGHARTRDYATSKYGFTLWSVLNL